MEITFGGTIGDSRFLSLRVREISRGILVDLPITGFN